MNIVIVDNANKKYHVYMHAREEIELFICGHINRINAKNETFLVVQKDIDLKQFENQKYQKDQGLFDKLIIDYNSSLVGNEKPLTMWFKNK